MKLTASGALLLFLSSPEASVSLEAGGVRVGGLLKSGSDVEVVEGIAGGLLVSGSVVEPLVGPVDVRLNSGKVIELGPGVRLCRDPRGLRLLTRGKCRLEVLADDRALVLASPVLVEPAAEAWVLEGGAVFRAARLRARRYQQDEVDKELDRLKREAQKLQETEVDRDLQTLKRLSAQIEGAIRRPLLKGPPGRRHTMPILDLHLVLALEQGMTPRAVVELEQASPLGF
jgi:hypothetical protein